MKEILRPVYVRDRAPSAIKNPFHLSLFFITEIGSTLGNELLKIWKSVKIVIRNSNIHANNRPGNLGAPFRNVLLEE